MKKLLLILTVVFSINASAQTNTVKAKMVYKDLTQYLKIQTPNGTQTVHIKNPGHIIKATDSLIYVETDCGTGCTGMVLVFLNPLKVKEYTDVYAVDTNRAYIATSYWQDRELKVINAKNDNIIFKKVILKTDDYDCVTPMWCFFEQIEFRGDTLYLKLNQTYKNNYTDYFSKNKAYKFHIR